MKLAPLSLLGLAAGLVACTVPTSVVKAVPTPDFPHPWGEESGAASPGAGAPIDDALTLPAAASIKKDAVAIVIGVEKYRRDLPPATGATTDARNFARLAERTIGVPPSQIRVLLDQDATKSSIDALLQEWLPRNVSQRGDVYFFFAGHGGPDPTTGARYLVPWDADPQFVTSQGLAVDTLAKRLQQLRAAHVFLFIDACFSGAGGRSVLAPGTRPIVLTKAAPIPVATKLVVLTASGPDEITGTTPAGRGLFTHHLIDGVAGAADANGDRTVTVGELFEHVEQHVTIDARRQNRDQRPRLTSAPGGTSLPLARFVSR